MNKTEIVLSVRPSMDEEDVERLLQFLNISREGKEVTVSFKAEFYMKHREKCFSFLNDMSTWAQSRGHSPKFTRKGLVIILK